MSKSDALHELYELCKDMKFEESNKILIQTKDEEEKGFIRTVTDYFLQQRQKEVISDKRFKKRPHMEVSSVSYVSFLI